MKINYQLRTIIGNWIRNSNTIELLGLWEKLHNPDFKQVEFDLFKNIENNIKDNYQLCIINSQLKIML